MSKIAINFSKMKHVKSDKEYTTLKHPAGHTITLAHNALAPEVKQQLSALANISKDAQTQSQADESKHKAAEGYEKLRKHSFNYDKGGEVKPKNIEEAQDKAIKEIKDKKHLIGTKHNESPPNPRIEQRKTYRYAEGEEVKPEAPKAEPVFNTGDKYKKQAEQGGPTFMEGLQNIKDEVSHIISKAEGGRVDTSTQGKDVRHANKHKQQGQHEESEQAMDYAKNEAKGRAEFERKAIKPKMKGLAEGGEVDGAVKMAKGGHLSHEEYANEVSEANYPYEAGLPCLNPKCKSHGKPHPNCRCYSGGERYAEGGKVEYYCDSDRPHFSDCEYHVSKVKKYAEGDEVNSDESSLENTIQKEIDEKNKSTENLEQEIENQQNKPDVKKDYTAGFNENDPEQPQQPVQAQEQAAQQSAQPQPKDKQVVDVNFEPDTITAQNPDKINDPIARNAYYRQAYKDDMMNHSAEWEQDLRNGHITPETYASLFSKKDTLGKIGTFFGMLLSGAGSGLAHQPNALLHMMDQQIQNDLNAQQKSKENAHNYLRLSQQHEMNRANIDQLNADTAIKSYALAQSRMLQSSFQHLVKTTAAMPEGPQKAQAMQTLGMIYSQVGSKINNLQDSAAAASAYYKMLGLNNQSQGPGGLTPTQQQRRSQAIIGSANPFASASQYDTEHTIPGVQGQSEQPIQQQDRDKVQSMNVLDNKVRDVLAFAQQHRGSLNPQVIAQAKQKAEELTSFYNQSVDSLGMTQGRLSWLEEQIKKNPTSIIQQILGNNARLAEIRDSNVNRKEQLLHDKLGFPRSNQQQGTAQPQSKEQQSSKPVPAGYKRQIINGTSYFVPIK